MSNLDLRTLLSEDKDDPAEVQSDNTSPGLDLLVKASGGTAPGSPVKENWMLGSYHGNYARKLPSLGFVDQDFGIFDIDKDKLTSLGARFTLKRYSLLHTRTAYRYGLRGSLWHCRVRSIESGLQDHLDMLPQAPVTKQSYPGPRPGGYCFALVSVNDHSTLREDIIIIHKDCQMPRLWLVTRARERGGRADKMSRA